MLKPITSIGNPLLGVTASGGVVEFPSDSHMLTVARPGAGKGQSVIIPNLATYPGSVIVLDMKSGENAAYTARWRNEGPLRQPVYPFDPFHVVADGDLPASGRASFDPIAFIAAAHSPFTAAQQVAEALIIPGDKDSHWTDAATLVLAGVMLFVATDPTFNESFVVDFCRSNGIAHPRSMRTAWAIISNQRFQPLQLEMVQSHDSRIAMQGSVLCDMKLVQTKDGPGFDKVPNPKENGSIRSTLVTQCIATLGEEAIMATLEGRSVDFSTLSRVPSSVFIVLPGSMMPTHKRYLRLLLRVAMAQIEGAGLVQYVAGQKRPSTLVILDEMASLGRFPAIPEAMGRMRGYGLKFWCFVQTLSQLREHYGEGWTTIPGNAGVVQYFGGTNDEFTAERISKWTGEYTGTKRGNSQSTAPGGGFSTNDSLYGRPLLFPGQVRGIPDGTQVLLYLNADGYYSCGMMAQHSPVMFPEYRRYMESSTRKRPVYRTPAKTSPASKPAAAPAPVSKAAAAPTGDYSKPPGAVKAASAGPQKSTSNASTFDMRTFLKRDKPWMPPAGSRSGAKETAFEGDKPVQANDTKPSAAPAASATAPAAQVDSRVVIRCPRDGKGLRVPTDRGAIEVTCPCGHKWVWSPPAKVTCG